MNDLCERDIDYFDYYVSICFFRFTLNQILVNLKDKFQEIEVCNADALFELGFTVNTSRKIAEEMSTCPLGLNDWEVLEVSR